MCSSATNNTAYNDSDSLHKRCQDDAVEQTKTATYIHHPNGLVERMNRTSIDHIRRIR